MPRARSTAGAGEGEGKREGEGEGLGRQAVLLLAPGAEEVPSGQGRHAALLVAPTVGLYEPAGQAVGGGKEVALGGAQKKPAGHSTGVPVLQACVGGQGTQVSWRMR